MTDYNTPTVITPTVIIPTLITPTVITPTLITPTIITPTLNTSTVTDSLCNSGTFSNPNTVRDCPLFAHAVNRYVFAPISVHPCVKLEPEQS
jgi:hypothetical protein